MPDARLSLDVLLDLTKRLAEDLPLEGSLQAVADAALRLLPGDHASIRLLDDSRTELLCGARAGHAASQQAVQFRPGEGVIGWVVENGASARIDDVANDPRFLRKTGQGFDIRSILAVPLGAGERVVGVLSMTSGQVAAFTPDDLALAQLLANCTVPPIDRARLKRLAITDPQTLALTQACLGPRLQEEVERARKDITPMSVFALKPDQFDEVNTRFGAQAGDQALRVLASRLRSCMRKRDVLVRRGGVAFCVLLPETSATTARALGERMRLAVGERPIPVPGGSAALTVSVGSATWDGREPADRVLERATVAYEAARSQGRNRVIGDR